MQAGPRSLHPQGSWYSAHPLRFPTFPAPSQPTPHLWPMSPEGVSQGSQQVLQVGTLGLLFSCSSPSPDASCHRLGTPPSGARSGDSIHVKPTFLEPTGPARSSHTGDRCLANEKMMTWPPSPEPLGSASSGSPAPSTGSLTPTHPPPALCYCSAGMATTPGKSTPRLLCHWL